MGYLFLSSWIYLHFNTANLTWVLTFSSIPLPLLKNLDAPLNTPIFHPPGRTTSSFTNLDSHVQIIETSVLSLLCWWSHPQGSINDAGPKRTTSCSSEHFFFFIIFKQQRMGPSTILFLVQGWNI